MCIHYVNIRMQSPWLFCRRVQFAVTYRCLSTAAAALILISLLSAASVERVVQSSGKLLKREVRGQCRD